MRFQSTKFLFSKHFYMKIAREARVIYKETRQKLPLPSDLVVTLKSYESTIPCWDKMEMRQIYRQFAGQLHEL